MIRTSRSGATGPLGSSLLVLSAILFVCSAPASARPQAPAATPRAPITGDVYVAPKGNDSGDGSQQHPWATITHASQMIGPGATVHVAPGTYDEVVVTKTSGTASARIKYISDKKGVAEIAPAKKTGIAWNDTGDYNDIVGFNVGSDSCTGLVTAHLSGEPLPL